MTNKENDAFDLALAALVASAGRFAFEAGQRYRAEHPEDYALLLRAFEEGAEIRAIVTLGATHTVRMAAVVGDVVRPFYDTTLREVERTLN